MSRVFYHPGPAFNTTPIKRWVPSLGIWGFGVGTAALYVLSVTPIMKRTFFTKIPVLGGYFEDKTPPEDKPF